ncbi:MAG: sugar ABC transporter permease [Firmicutes bacterium]|nr:sugar ABC transporter permease [Bacillota bacterium]
MEKIRKKKSMKSMKRQESITYLLFMAPAVIAFALVEIVPFFQGLYYSFTDWTGLPTNPIHWVGIQNYIDAFTDSRFQYSFLITLIFALANFVLVNVVSFSLAMLVSSKLKGKNIYRAGFFVPNLIGGLVLGYIWQFIFNNVVVSLPFYNGLSLLANPNTALVGLVIVSNWQYAGYIMMIYFTALQGVPKELGESAELDGCNGWQKLWKVTIPNIMSTLTVTLFLTLSNSFKQYDVVLSLTNGGPSRMWQGAAINGTELVSLNIVKTASTDNLMALGQAKAVIFFVFLVVITLIQTSITRRKEIES